MSEKIIKTEYSEEMQRSVVVYIAGKRTCNQDYSSYQD